MLSTVRAIELDPEDWLWATWRPAHAQAAPEPAPFDLEKCLDRLAKVNRTSQFQHWDWSKARLDPFMTREEAHFWFVVDDGMHTKGRVTGHARGQVPSPERSL